jgi:hypothetical protein
MKLNLSELTLTSFNSVKLNLLQETSWLPWNVTNTNPQFSKANLTTLNLSNFKMIEAMVLKIIALRSP